MIKYTQGKNHSLLQKLKENCQINFIVPLSYKASSKLMAHNSTTNEKRRKAIFKSVIKSQWHVTRKLPVRFLINIVILACRFLQGILILPQ